MAEKEPDYLKAMRDQQARQKQTSGKGGNATPAQREGLSMQEREAVKLAREAADGKDVVVQNSLRGAKAAVLFKPASIDGRAPITLDGVPTREGLGERLKVAEQNGQEVLGCYEVATARPLEVERKGGEISFKAGKARALPKPMSPDAMIRKAAKEAEELAKSRKFDDRGGFGGRGGQGGGRGGQGGQGGGRGPGGDRGRGGQRGPGGPQGGTQGGTQGGPQGA